FLHNNNARLSVTGSYASCPSPLFLITLLSISLTRFNPRCGFFEHIFGLLNSCCSALQLLLALTQIKKMSILK
ncbi:unnamed protein product, partial [Hymenolepis diminuta]